LTPREKDKLLIFTAACWQNGAKRVGWNWTNRRRWHLFPRRSWRARATDEASRTWWADAAHARRCHGPSGGANPGDSSASDVSRWDEIGHGA